VKARSAARHKYAANVGVRHHPRAQKVARGYRLNTRQRMRGNACHVRVVPSLWSPYGGLAGVAPPPNAAPPGARHVKV